MRIQHTTSSARLHLGDARLGSVWVQKRPVGNCYRMMKIDEIQKDNANRTCLHLRKVKRRRWRRNIWLDIYYIVPRSPPLSTSPPKIFAKVIERLKMSSKILLPMVGYTPPYNYAFHSQHAAGTQALKWRYISVFNHSVCSLNSRPFTCFQGLAAIQKGDKETPPTTPRRSLAV